MAKQNREPMNGKLKDRCGKLICIGDYIVYGKNLGRSAVIQFGKVVDVWDHIGDYGGRSNRIQVIAVHEGYTKKVQKKTTLYFTDRMMVIPEEMLPPDVAKKLSEIKE